MNEFGPRNAIVCLPIWFGLSLLALPGGLPAAETATSPDFHVGTGKRDITPQAPTPMWGYGARHDALSQGTLDPLFAKALVLQVGDEKLAIVGTDLGRGPTPAMMSAIREGVRREAGIEHVLICGSHSHHGPVIELTDQEGMGRGKFDDAVNYTEQLTRWLIEVILEADRMTRPARMGTASRELDFNRNRHSKREPKARDPLLWVVRFDDLEGKPIALLVNFAAHPVMTEASLLKFSADYPGFLQEAVEQQLGAPCLFIQGASGDLSPNPGRDRRGPKAFGQALAGQALELSSELTTEIPRTPSLQVTTDQFQFSSRVDFNNRLIAMAYSQAFFPELIRNYTAEFSGGIQPELNTVVLNGELAIVTGSGEFFSSHATRIRERSYIDHTLFFGYCNGHHLYFPTIEAASEGGYGADMTVSPVELGAGEQMMNQALVNIYVALGQLAPPAASPTQPAASPRRSAEPSPEPNTDQEEAGEGEVSRTFSIVAVDPETGICGAAVASKYPAVGKVVPYVRAGVGAFCTQHWHHPPWGEQALDLLEQGLGPEEVLGILLKEDPRRDKRQLAIIDMQGRAANRNPADADPSGVYWGAMSGKYYACQGNTLVGREVIEAMSKAYEETEGSLADRLMAALVAGDHEGGDHRGRLAAGIRIAKRGVEGIWLELQVEKSEDAVLDLLRKYEELQHEAKGSWPGREVTE
jgi:neutral ceramidase